MDYEPLETAEGAEHAACQQLSIFLQNHVGELVRVMRLLGGGPIHIVGLSVEGKVDCAVLRLLVNDPDAAYELLSGVGMAMAQSEVLVVELPPGNRGITAVCTALITGEVNINYAYTVWATSEHTPCLAIQVDNLEQAVHVLSLKDFRVLAQDEL